MMPNQRLRVSPIMDELLLVWVKAAQDICVGILLVVSDTFFCYEKWNYVRCT